MVLVVVAGMPKNSLVFWFGPEVSLEYPGGRRAWVRSGHRIQNDQRRLHGSQLCYRYPPSFSG